MSTVRQLVLERAIQKLGERPLASRLGISRLMLRALLAGVRPVPDSIWLRAVDVLDEVSATPPGPHSPQRGPSSNGPLIAP